MPEIVYFKSRAQLNAKQNLAEFVRLCRDDLTVFGVDLPFDTNVWDITKYTTKKGRSKTTRIIFSNESKLKARPDTSTMPADFLPFAKAYFRYSYGLNPTTAWSKRLAALRALGRTLYEEGHGGDVTAVSHDILTETCNHIIRKYSKAVAPMNAGALEDISDFLVANELAEMSTRWATPIRRNSDDTWRVGKTADDARERKMPSAAAIEAMAYAFRNASHPLEIYIGSALALLHCAPQRINETVRLKIDCEVEGKDAEGRSQYGLRWSGSKGFEDGIKWILPSMVEVALLAIKRLREATQEARRIAAWYEANPTKIYLPAHLEHLRQKSWIDQSEASLVLYGDENPLISIHWCYKNQIPRQSGKVLFTELQEKVLQRMPKEFPWAQPDLKFSEALFIVRRFELDSTLRTYTCLVDYLSYDQISSRLGRPSSSASSIFQQFGLTEDDGTPISLTTHQVRHYLNTLAQSNNVAQIDIAMWSGRADISQNSAYDHTTPDQILSNARDLAVTSNSSLFGGNLDIPKPRVVATRNTTGVLRTGTAHITDYGMCTHDFAMSPCEIHRDCLNCNELVCIKGDGVKTKNIRLLKDQTDILLKEAEVAEKTSVYGASRWVKHHRETLEHCTQLLNILDDPMIEPGALVRLTGLQPASRIAQTEEVRYGPSPLAAPAKPNKLLMRLKRG